MASTTRKPVPSYVTMEQAARMTQQSVKTIRRRVSDGTLPAYRFGPRSIRVRLEDLESAAHRIPAARK